ncbi:MAG: TatD family hydrolase [Alistipes sp.]
MYIDTHSHIYVEEFDADREEVIRRALDAGVVRMLLPAIDAQSYERMFALSRAHAECCTPMIGLHPTSVNDNPLWHEELAQVEEYLKNPPAGAFCAVGEIGLDFYWSAQFKEEQTEAFRRQIEWALEYDLPIAVHVRGAWTETVALIEEFAGRGLRGVFHAFTETVECYHALKACGDFVFGIGGVVTFKKSTLPDVVRQMALDDMVLETDCPYLTPAPHRGKRNESANVTYICAKIAEIKDLSAEEVAARTTANARRIFGI